MTEQDKQKLVEAMCRAFITGGNQSAVVDCYEAELYLRGIKDPLMARMAAAIDAIDASDTHCVLPVEPTEAMHRAATLNSSLQLAFRAMYIAARDACLAERRGEGR